MNIEEQCLDLCNVKTKGNIDEQNTSSDTESVTSRISELMTDSERENQKIVPTAVSETYMMPQLTDNRQAGEENNHQVHNTLEIDEVNGNGTSTALDTSVIANPTDFFYSNEQHMDNIGVEIMKVDKDTDAVASGGASCGDIEIGVALSPDDTGVLDVEPTNDRSLSDNTLDSVPSSQDDPPASTTECQASFTETPSTNQVGLYPSVEEENGKHKPSGKRVTFPSDEDIVSGAVEPKDPWRHGKYCA